MRNSPRTLLLFAFLIIILSSILPVSSLQNNINISSHGTVDYSGIPPPSPNTWNLDITVTPTNSGKAAIVAPINVDVQEIPVAQGVTVSAIPNQGYSFVNWKLDNVASTQNPIPVGPYSAGSTHTLVATFTIANLPKEPYVGFRCNGERTPEYWIDMATRYSNLVSDTSAGGIWIIPASKVLTFDSGVDNALTELDKNNVKVYLQAGEEVAGVWNQYPASCGQLIQSLLNNYGGHSCVIGVGLDTELRAETENPIPVTDAE
ncbi:MAG: hypothetical protein O2V44_07300, partial [Candidatus Bathyarchaeota archaeon]|nr:hypothetical protein [Candidatus Bathyarchaeota archaeon]